MQIAFALFNICKTDSCSRYYGVDIIYKIIDIFQYDELHYTREITTEMETLFLEIFDEYIPKLCCNLFHLSHEVVHLTIKYSNVKELQDNCYENVLKNVSFEINISFNQIKYLNKRTFNNLRIVEIHLQWNLIKAIENETFFNLPNLIWVDLSGNQLQKLNPQTFIEVPVLHTMILQRLRFF